VKLNMNENLMIYRIVQELLTNSLKHASANEILIQIMFTSESLNLTVEDDGVGFDERKTKTASSGWHNIKSRVNYLQGTLNLHTDPTAGTSVTVSIPLK
jgi:signal transduction histidine kinase